MLWCETVRAAAVSSLVIMIVHGVDSLSGSDVRAMKGTG